MIVFTKFLTQPQRFYSCSFSFGALNIFKINSCFFPNKFLIVCVFVYIHTHTKLLTPIYIFLPNYINPNLRLKPFIIEKDSTMTQPQSLNDAPIQKKKMPVYSIGCYWSCRFHMRDECFNKSPPLPVLYQNLFIPACVYYLPVDPTLGFIRSFISLIFCLATHLNKQVW